MANTNSNINKAKSAKSDEFYTMMPDIEKEMEYYSGQFKDKVIYCNCDDVRYSNFTRYFMENFERLGLRKLISTGYSRDGKGVLFTYGGKKTFIGDLRGNGDFRSDECVEYLKEADIVVTNPPFSLFREYFSQLMEYGKKFIVLGNVNAITDKVVFPYVQCGKLWLGRSIHSGDREFKVPESYPLDAVGVRVDEYGNRYIRVKGVRWLTNMDTGKEHDVPVLDCRYSGEKYPKYDNYDAINVGRLAEIPYDYDGVMGVPITVIDKICPDGLAHFRAPFGGQETLKYAVKWQLCGNTRQNCPTDILKELDYKPSKEDRGGCGLIDGKRVYARILIQKVK